MQREGNSEPGGLREGREADDQEGRKQDRSAEGRIELRRPVAPGGNPTTDAGIGDNRGCLARDIDGKNLGASHSVDLCKKDREEPVERGETTEQKEDADQIDSEGPWESHPGALSRWRDEMENPHRKEATLLDAWVDVDETDLATVHPNGRLARPELAEEAREETRGRP